ncbi:hypothetical protein SUGI_0346830 [Cryptomeria japonica]|nr:hypothetical protein SUGI_0346830 [Cryptomeria japonica]
MCIDSAGYSASRFSRSWCGGSPESSTTFQLENLKRFHLNMTLFYDPTPLLTYLLRVAPALKSLFLSREKGFDGTNALRFVNWLLNLRR